MKHVQSTTETEGAQPSGCGVRRYGSATLVGGPR